MNRTLAVFTAVVLLAVTLILSGSIPATFTPVAPTAAPTPTLPPETARGTALNTEAVPVLPRNIVPFTRAQDMQNITWEPLSVLRIGAGWGGTYIATYEVNLNNNTFGFPAINIFTLEVNGVVVSDTRALIYVMQGRTETLHKSAEIYIPSGADVRLVSIINLAQLTNVKDGQSVPSATLTLERIGD